MQHNVMIYLDYKDQIEKLYADFLEWRLMDDPEYASLYNIHTYDHLVSQWTEEHFTATGKR